MWEKIPSSSSTTDNTNVVAVVLCGEKKIESENSLTEKLQVLNCERKNVREIYE